MTFFGCSRQVAKEIHHSTRGKPLYTQTYNSGRRKFSLNPENIFDITHDIECYKHVQNMGAMMQDLRPANSVLLQYEGDRLIVTSGRYPKGTEVDTEIELKRATLAEVILVDSKLSMLIHGRRDLVVDPKDLIEIGERYSI